MPRKRLESYKLFYEQIPVEEFKAEKPKVVKAKPTRRAIEEDDQPIESVLATEVEVANSL